MTVLERFPECRDNDPRLKVEPAHHDDDEDERGGEDHDDDHADADNCPV